MHRAVVVGQRPDGLLVAIEQAQDKRAVLGGLAGRGLWSSFVRIGGITPGWTELTRMPSRANWIAAALLASRTAPFAA